LNSLFGCWKGKNNLKKRISILGCGWLGKALAVQLIQNDYDIKGSSTSISKLKELQTKGINSFIIDINNNTIDISNFLSSDILIIAIPSKIINDFKNLLLEIEKSQLRKVIFISSTSVYLNTNEIVTEESPISNSSLSEIENIFRANTLLDTTIIRFGGLFGYDRKPSNFIKTNKEIENPEGYINFIHRDDCVQIIEKIIVNDVWNITLNACADSHPKRRDFYKKELKKIGVTSPSFNEDALNAYKIISNEKLKTLLNYKFKYSDLMSY
jgi:nucleoside-diphosphate-sugar epimerase